MALKDWKKSSKYKSKKYTMFLNVLPQYWKFEDNYDVTVGDNGNESYFSVTKAGILLSSQTFKKYSDALKAAKKYMRTH